VQEQIELCKIYEFIDLPDNIRNIEKVNSAILRNYYSNALDNNLLEIKTVKYSIGAHNAIFTGNVKYSKKIYINKHMEYLGLPFYLNKKKIEIREYHKIQYYIFI
jgi:hypothetical protein